MPSCRAEWTRTASLCSHNLSLGWDASGLGRNKARAEAVPPGLQFLLLQVIKTAITADYLAVHGQPAAGNDARTHLIHATCRRQQQPARRRAGGTVPGLCT